jgi:DNA-binding NarL/FixJ family response regulator
MPRYKVLIADDHVLVADLCRRLLEGEFDVVGSVADGHALITVAVELKPDVILVDIGMPILNGLDAGQQVKQLLPAVKLIFLTMNTDLEVAAESFRRGGSGYLLKTCAAWEVVTAVREVLRGETYVSPSLSRKGRSYLRRQNLNPTADETPLTGRQREVLQLLAEGRVMKEVGAILNMTTRTVAFHKYRIMEVLGAQSNADLVRYAVRTHMIST